MTGRQPASTTQAAHAPCAASTRRLRARLCSCAHATRCTGCRDAETIQPAWHGSTAGLAGPAGPGPLTDDEISWRLERVQRHLLWPHSQVRRRRHHRVVRAVTSVLCDRARQAATGGTGVSAPGAAGGTASAWLQRPAAGAAVTCHACWQAHQTRTLRSSAAAERHAHAAAWRHTCAVGRRHQVQHCAVCERGELVDVAAGGGEEHGGGVAGGERAVEHDARGARQRRLLCPVAICPVVGADMHLAVQHPAGGNRGRRT